MKMSRSIRFGIGAIAVALAATACGGDETRSVTSSAENGSLVVGIKYDQPGLGLRNPDGTFS
jgi:glutamate transport system substrate-binding protein